MFPEFNFSRHQNRKQIIMSNDKHIKLDCLTIIYKNIEDAEFAEKLYSYLTNPPPTENPDIVITNLTNLLHTACILLDAHDVFIDDTEEYTPTKNLKKYWNLYLKTKVHGETNIVVENYIKHKNKIEKIMQERNKPKKKNLRQLKG